MTALQAGLLVALFLTAFTVLLYLGRGYWAWVVTVAIALGGWAVMEIESPRAFAAALGASLVATLVFGVPAMRRCVVTFWLMRPVGAMLPRRGDTERIALEAGTVWWDGDLFSGNPDWRKLLDFKVRLLSNRERAFLDGPVQELCTMLDDWTIGQAGDLSPEVWDFIKRHRFFGMIIPEEYGGLGFSAIAHSAVVTKLASRSVTAAVTVMVPNSLGPAELLLHYGTEEQKRSYLPRLAAGQEIPCFALTGPEAGSDAAATQSLGIVCHGTFEGREVLGMSLNWRKRYITLGPVSTVIGLAFRLRDPERLLGETEDLGITCALVPSHLPGIEIGKRHDPMGIPFQNGPNSGRDVFVPIDFIIGGPARAGQGWRMLMESLAAGRSISLPALSVGAAQLATRVVGAYATVREQFDTPIGRFEGIEEPLARIGGWTYLMSATRTLTASAVDAGERPAVVSAIAKCYLTEGMRAVMSDAMDIRAGAGICCGPRNTLARALFGHIASVLTNTARGLLLGLTGARLARSPVRGPLARFLRQLSRMSTAFALVSDAAMATLGGQLKRREKLSGRLADALAWLYLASASVKRFWDEGQSERDRPLLEWVGRHALHQIQDALCGILDNLPNRFAARALRWVVFPLGARYRPPSDALGAQVARALLEDREERLRLTRDIYVPPPHEPGLGRLEAALDKVVEALAVEAKIRDALRAGRIDRAPGDALVELAREAAVITEEDCQRIRAADAARDEAIQVDAFDPDEYRALVR